MRECGRGRRGALAAPLHKASCTGACLQRAQHRFIAPPPNSPRSLAGTARALPIVSVTCFTPAPKPAQELGWSDEESFVSPPAVGPDATVRLLAVADLGQAEIDGCVFALGAVRVAGPDAVERAVRCGKWRKTCSATLPQCSSPVCRLPTGLSPETDTLPIETCRLKLAGRWRLVRCCPPCTPLPAWQRRWLQGRSCWCTTATSPVSSLEGGVVPVLMLASLLAS